MSAETYLGEKPFEQKDTPFKDFCPTDWAMYFIERYGGIDGAHHKDWVLDQVARILKGSPIEINQATWTDHEPEWRVTVGEPSAEYLEWVAEMRDGEDGPDTYDYSEGIAP